jgi:predicted dehydrogenase
VNRPIPTVLRWGIVGTGAISEQIASDFALVRDCEVTAVCSRSLQSADAFAERFEIENRFDDYDIMLGSEIDAVYIGTPHVTHFELARRALLAGRHVLCEKPLALNAEQVRELALIAEDSNRFLMEAMWMKFNPLYLKLGELIYAGAIGDVRSVRSSFGAPFPRDDSSRWKRGGSTLLDQGIYPVTLSHMFLGDPARITASGVMRDDGVDLSEYFTLTYTDGRFAHGAASMVDYLDLTAAVAGTSGWVAIEPGFWFASALTLHRYTPAGPVAERIEVTREGHGYVPMLREVTATILHGGVEHPRHTIEQTARTFDILDEIRRQVAASAADS